MTTSCWATETWRLPVGPQKHDDFLLDYRNMTTSCWTTETWPLPVGPQTHDHFLLDYRNKMTSCWTTDTWRLPVGLQKHDDFLLDHINMTTSCWTTETWQLPVGLQKQDDFLLDHRLMTTSCWTTETWRLPVRLQKHAASCWTTKTWWLPVGPQKHDDFLLDHRNMLTSCWTTETWPPPVGPQKHDYFLLDYRNKMTSCWTTDTWRLPVGPQKHDDFLLDPSKLNWLLMPDTCWWNCSSPIGRSLVSVLPLGSKDRPIGEPRSPDEARSLWSLQSITPFKASCWSETLKPFDVQTDRTRRITSCLDHFLSHVVTSCLDLVSHVVFHQDVGTQGFRRISTLVLERWTHTTSSICDPICLLLLLLLLLLHLMVAKRGPSGPLLFHYRRPVDLRGLSAGGDPGLSLRTTTSPQ